MSTVVLAHRATVRAHMRQQADNPRLEQWHRLGCLAWVYANDHGHARMAVGQISRELGLPGTRVSDAIRRAGRLGWLDPCSTARCLVLPGHALNPCEEDHDG